MGPNSHPKGEIFLFVLLLKGINFSHSNFNNKKKSRYLQVFFDYFVNIDFSFSGNRYQTKILINGGFLHNIFNVPFHRFFIIAGQNRLPIQTSELPKTSTFRLRIIIIFPKYIPAKLVGYLQ